MKIVRTLLELQEARAAMAEAGGKVAFVPTMGALHAGHLSLVSRALDMADHVIVSIYVNPTQFAPHEDFDSYPRDVETDAQALRGLKHADGRLDGRGVDVIYAPSFAEIYPDGRDDEITKRIESNADGWLGEAALGLEESFRPHFFKGVVNVVKRLFDQVRPDIAVFGEKDFQQLQVIRAMAAASGGDIDIVGAPIARDSEGLALSSRNAYLSDQELVIARKLNVILRAVASGDLDEVGASAALLDAGFDKVDYVAIRWKRVLGAAWLGKTRLIDNLAA